MLKIKPAPTEVQIKIEVPKAGVLDLSGKPIGIEIGEVIAVGEVVTTYKPKDKIVFKSWALDIVNVEGDNYYFINIESNGIKGIVK